MALVMIENASSQQQQQSTASSSFITSKRERRVGRHQHHDDDGALPATAAADAGFQDNTNSNSNTSHHHNGTPEVVSGHLLMLASTGAAGHNNNNNRQQRHQTLWPVFARLYKTSAGRMLVLWPDKVHASPIGCVTLNRDVAVVCDDETATITLSSQQYDAVPLVLRVAATCGDEYRRWTSALRTNASAAHDAAAFDRSRCRKLQRKFTTDVVRLPMLIEEEP